VNDCALHIHTSAEGLQPELAALNTRIKQLRNPRDTITNVMPKKSLRPGLDAPLLRLLRNQCFACGKGNPDGMHLKFIHDKARNCFVCRFRLDERFTGPPGHCHGGIIATILDEAMGKVNRLRDVVAVTSELTVKYLRPVPLNKPLRVVSREVRVFGRCHINEAEILNQKGEILARGQGTFIAIDPRRMFAKYVDKSESAKQVRKPRTRSK
jgi:uncharacterized protein (TIGR00369 family)